MKNLIKIRHPNELIEILHDVCIQIHKEYQQKKSNSQDSTEELKKIENLWLVINNIELLLGQKNFFADQYIVPIDLKKAFEISGVPYDTPTAIVYKDKILSIVRDKYNIDALINYPKKIIEFILI